MEININEKEHVKHMLQCPSYKSSINGRIDF